MMMGWCLNREYRAKRNTHLTQLSPPSIFLPLLFSFPPLLFSLFPPPPLSFFSPDSSPTRTMEFRFWQQEETKQLKCN